MDIDFLLFVKATISRKNSVLFEPIFLLLWNIAEGNKSFIFYVNFPLSVVCPLVILTGPDIHSAPVHMTCCVQAHLNWTMPHLENVKITETF